MQEIFINLAVEDRLSEAVLRKLLIFSKQNYKVSRCFMKRGFGYLKKNIQGFNNAAKTLPFLVLTDLDRVECAPSLIKTWLPKAKNPNMLFRVAVREVESWLLADRNNFSKFLGIAIKHIPEHSDNIDNPKELLIKLAAKSRKRELRDAIVPFSGSTAKIGPDYNSHLISFVNTSWNIDEAARNSPSLKQSLKIITNFNPV